MNAMRSARTGWGSRLWRVCSGVMLLLLLGSAGASADQEVAAKHKVAVVNAYEGEDLFAGAAGKSDLQHSWREDVLSPYLNQCAGGGEYFDLPQIMLSRPIADRSGLEREISALRGADSRVKDAVNSAFQKAEAALPGPDIQLCIFAADPQWMIIRDMGGVDGITAGTGRIIFLLQPVGSWLERIPFAFAHEYHHSVWTAYQSGAVPVFDLAQYLIFEGRADSFAHLVFPQATAPWDNALTAEQERAVWKQMKPDLNNPDMMQQRRYMFGGQDVPRWAGYTIGFHIVQAYLRSHPGASAKEWTKLDAHELVKQSGYSS